MFKKYRKFFFIFWGLVVIGTVSIVILFVLIANGSLGTMPAFEELENPNNKFASEIYYEDATKMGQYFNEENNYG